MYSDEDGLQQLGRVSLDSYLCSCSSDCVGLSVLVGELPWSLPFHFHFSCESIVIQLLYLIVLPLLHLLVLVQHSGLDVSARVVLDHFSVALKVLVLFLQCDNLRG